jgi:hypothetical protein
MIRQKTQVAPDDFESPPFEARYRVSAGEHDPGSPISAAVTRTGLGGMVECVNAARNLYNFTRILVAVSLICSVLGMVIVLLLSRGDAPSASWEAACCVPAAGVRRLGHLVQNEIAY